MLERDPHGVAREATVAGPHPPRSRTGVFAGMKRTGSTVRFDRQTLWRSSARINGDTRRYEAIVFPDNPFPIP